MNVCFFWSRPFWNDGSFVQAIYIYMGEQELKCNFVSNKLVLLSRCHFLQDADTLCIFEFTQYIFQVEPGKPGAEVSKGKNYKPKKEFAYRMCTG